MNIHTARLLGQVETAIFAGEMDAEQAVQYMIYNSEIDADDLDQVRAKIQQTVADANREPKQ